MAYTNDIMHYASVVLIFFPKRNTDLFKISIFRILYVLPIIKKWPGSKFYSFICFFSQTKANQQSTYRFDSLISIERWSYDTSLKYRLKNIMSLNDGICFDPELIYRLITRLILIQIYLHRLFHPNCLHDERGNLNDG